jgi:regulator of protease activity HflC (stomatin/prohibitin superfamily)
MTRFTTITSLILLLTCCPAVSAIFGAYKCPEGHRCVRYRGGSLLDTIDDPGWNYHEPFLTTAVPIETVYQTDTLLNIACASNQGSKVHFDIDVINKLDSSDKCILKVLKGYGLKYDKPLIYDYIPSEVDQFCKNFPLDDLYITMFDEVDDILHAKLVENLKSYGVDDCISVKGIRLRNKRVSKEMQERYERTEQLKKEQEHAKQDASKQRILQATAHEKARAMAEQEKLTHQYGIDRTLAEAKSKAEVQSINNLAERKKVLIAAKSASQATMLEAEANKELLTEAYLESKRSEALLSNAKLIIDPTVFSNSNTHSYMPLNILG